MNALLLDPEKFHRHYNCSAYEVSLIPLQQQRSVVHSLCVIPIAILLELLCFLGLYAISRPRLLRTPSYKLMFALAVTEVIEIFIVGIVAALFGLTGTVYCSKPLLNMIFGTTALGVWYFEGQISLALAFNRCLLMYSSSTASRLFDEWAIFAWIGVPVLVSIVLLAADAPILYSAVGGGFFFEPHLGYLPRNPYFFNWTHFVFNHAVPFGLIAIYTVFGLLIYRRKRMGSTSSQNQQQQSNQKISTREFSLFLQISIICLLTMCSCIGYAYQSFFDDHKWFVTLTADVYLLYLGTPSFVYLCLNKSVRHEAGNLLQRLCGHRLFHDPATTVAVATMTRGVTGTRRIFPNKSIGSRRVGCEPAGSMWTGQTKQTDSKA